MDRKAAKRKLKNRSVTTETGCWEWQGAKAGGYGCVNIEGKNWWCHRLAWVLFRGPIPNGKCVCHDCPGGDNPACWNPAHLFVGTSVENTHDRHRKGRDAAGERNGNAKLTDEDVGTVRRRYDGKYGRLRELANEFRCSVDQIRNIVRGKQRMKGVGKVDWQTTRLLRPDGKGYLGGHKSPRTS